ncbi:MAG: hypothetical protein HND48_11805 [Chloroflexi bacterium]|nr:hypothetical protein [Chloroflexota bacterium]
MKLRILLLLLFVVVVAAACAAPPELRNPQFLIDDSLVDNEPCSAPCWNGITPGVTKWGDALTILEDTEGIVDLKTETNDDPVKSPRRSSVTAACRAAWCTRATANSSTRCFYSLPPKTRSLK